MLSLDICIFYTYTWACVIPQRIHVIVHLEIVLTTASSAAFFPPGAEYFDPVWDGQASPILAQHLDLDSLITT